MHSFRKFHEIPRRARNDSVRVIDDSRFPGAHQKNVILNEVKDLMECSLTTEISNGRGETMREVLRIDEKYE
jgi:hypothetical protein